MRGAIAAYCTFILSWLFIVCVPRIVVTRCVDRDQSRVVIAAHLVVIAQKEMLFERGSPVPLAPKVVYRVGTTSTARLYQSMRMEIVH